ncbi:MAG: hypothetical protein LLG01_14745 [Planctomycetaceae bacterium]|nr:hypothetical protein [Planctomycetaceae bacterium]
MNGSSEKKLPWPKALRLALAFGIVWGGAMFLTGVVATYTQWYAHEMVRVFASVYYGFGASWPGAFLGLMWGFLDAFIGTLVIVAIYNVLGGPCRES